MIVIFCHKKDFWQLFDTISVFCDIEFGVVLQVFMDQFWAVFLTTNLATTEWTRKWRHRGKTPKQNKTNLQTTELLKQWSEQTTQKLPNKGL